MQYVASLRSKGLKRQKEAKTIKNQQETGKRQNIPQTQAPTHTHEAETGHIPKEENVKTGVRRRLDAEDVSTGFEDVSTGFTDIKSVSEKVSSGGEHIQAEEEAVKNARREELKRQDELAAKRLQEDLELSEAQKKRMAQVQEAAQFYIEED
ncbi:hypothetical protein Tco_1174428 [Tanacetum coccineum]